MDKVMLAEEFLGIWEELSKEQTTEMIRKNVDPEIINFFIDNAERLIAGTEIKDPKVVGQLPNLMLIGYLIRLLEERVR